MSQTVTIPAETLDEIFSRLNELSKAVKKISVRLLKEEPPYGSDKWWEWSERRADEDIKTGKLVRFDLVKDAIKWLNS